MKLKELFLISSGVNARRNSQGNTYYLQARDFLDERTIDPLLEPEILYSPKLDKHFLYSGDVLVLSKGHHGFRAYGFNEEKTPAVASSIFMVLRNTSKEILQEYLIWHINLESTQNYLINSSRGSALPAINKTILGELDVPVPSIEIQMAIVGLNKLKNKESKITIELDKLKKRVLEYQLKEIIK